MFYLFWIVAENLNKILSESFSKRAILYSLQGLVCLQGSGRFCWSTTGWVELGVVGHVGLEGDIGQMGLRQVDVRVAKEGVGHVGAPEGLERIFLPRLSSQAVAGKQGLVTPSLDPSEGETEQNRLNTRQ